jgi:hypothetical protein
MKILNIAVTILFIGSILTASGCKMPEEPLSVDMFTPQAQGQGRQVVAQDDDNMARRFANPDKSGDGETVAMWARRYDTLSAKADKLSADNTKSAVASSELRHKVIELETELKKTKAELDDAVKFLGDMQIELVNWKRDVLGNRDRIEAAHGVQIEYLTKIVKLLGGEAVEMEAQKDD